MREEESEKVHHQSYPHQWRSGKSRDGDMHQEAQDSCVNRTSETKNWSTPAGAVTTSHNCHGRRNAPSWNCTMIGWTAEWDFHVTKNLRVHDAIVRCDTLEFLETDIKFAL